MTEQIASRGLGYRAVFAYREFRALWLAELLSMIGDQFARVALSLLVFDRTGSALLTGLAYGATYVPTMLGGLFMGRLADRFPRRAVMVAVDLVRAVMALLMAIPSSPIGAVIAPVAVISLLHPVFKGAQLATLRTVLDDEGLFKRSSSLRQLSLQLGQIVGFALGGVLVAATSPAVALLVDAGTFVASASLLLAVRRRPATAGAGTRSTVTGLLLLWRDPRLRALTVVQVLPVCYMTFEAAAAPYSAQIGGGQAGTGWLLAAAAVGAAAGAYVTGWFGDRDTKLLTPMAVTTGLPLLACAFTPGLWPSLLVYALAGFGATSAVLISTNLIVLDLDDEVRGHVSSAMSALLMTAQGAAAGLVGWLGSTALGPALAIAVLAACGMLAAGFNGIAWRRAKANCWENQCSSPNDIATPLGQMGEKPRL